MCNQPFGSKTDYNLRIARYRCRWLCFPKRRGFAELTGHNLTGVGVQSHLTQGVGDETVNIWPHTFEIQLLNKDWNEVIWRGEKRIVGCLGHDKAPVLLGNAGFLEFFNIQFNYKTHQIIIALPD